MFPRSSCASGALCAAPYLEWLHDVLPRPTAKELRHHHVVREVNLHQSPALVRWQVEALPVLATQ